MSYRDSYRSDNRSYGGGRGRGGGGRNFGGSRPGDWDCSECGFMNYASRDECRDCKAGKPQGGGGGGYDRQRSRSPTSRSYDSYDKPRDSYKGGRGGGGYGGDRYNDRDSSFGRGRGGGGGYGGDRGDNWTCPNPKCEFSNFAKRYKCMKCDEPRPSAGRFGSGRDFGGRGDKRPGDWECSNCEFNNYASRDVCLKCQTSK